MRADETILNGKQSRADYPQRPRRVVALIEMNGIEREMEFPTNNFEWAANPLRWQVWMALLVYVLLRFQAFLSNWGGSFVRLWTCARASLGLKLDAVALLKSDGTAGENFRLLGQPETAYLPGFRLGPVG